MLTFVDKIVNKFGDLVSIQIVGDTAIILETSHKSCITN